MRVTFAQPAPLGLLHAVLWRTGPWSATLPSWWHPRGRFDRCRGSGASADGRRICYASGKSFSAAERCRTRHGQVTHRGRWSAKSHLARQDVRTSLRSPYPSKAASSSRCRRVLLTGPGSSERSLEDRQGPSARFAQPNGLPTDAPRIGVMPFEFEGRRYDAAVSSDTCKADRRVLPDHSELGGGIAD